MTIAEFFEARANGWLEVYSVPSEHGGEDVVLRLDGSYTPGLASGMADHFARWLQEVGIDARRAPHLDQPPPGYCACRTPARSPRRDDLDQCRTCMRPISRGGER